MKAAEIEVGGKYLARVSGKFVTVRVNEIGERFNSLSGRSSKVYHVTNLDTARRLVFRSAMRFRSKAKQLQS